MLDLEQLTKIGILGCGNMGSSIIQSLCQVYPTKEYYLYDSLPQKMESWVQQVSPKITACLNPQEVIDQAEVIFIAVKPKDLDGLFASFQLKENMPSRLWVSLLVGKSLEKIQTKLRDHDGVIRIMPNTPIAIGQGYISYCLDPETVSSQTESAFIELMRPLGQVQPIEEALFDIASAIAGSGPAFIYLLIEAISDAGVHQGLSRQLAIEMAAQTVVGAGQMVLSQNQHPAQLKDDVTSPMGTTIAGIRRLESAGFRSAIFEAIIDTVDRSQS